MTVGIDQTWVHYRTDCPRMPATAATSTMLVAELVTLLERPRAPAACWRCVASGRDLAGVQLTDQLTEALLWLCYPGAYPDPLARMADLHGQLATRPDRRHPSPLDPLVAARAAVLVEQATTLAADDGYLTLLHDVLDAGRSEWVRVHRDLIAGHPPRTRAEEVIGVLPPPDEVSGPLPVRVAALAATQVWVIHDYVPSPEEESLYRYLPTLDHTRPLLARVPAAAVFGSGQFWAQVLCVDDGYAPAEIHDVHLLLPTPPADPGAVAGLVAALRAAGT